MKGLASEKTAIQLYSLLSFLHITLISVGSLEGQNWQMIPVQRYLLGWLS